MQQENHFAPIAALDLDPIKVKLMHQESGEGWSREYADAVEFEYRRFLYLMKKFPTEQAAPLFDVDVFWHYHILDTMKYAVDCDAIFGYFLHHFPYVGLRGEDDRALHHRVGERMRELYEETYGEAYIRAQAAEGCKTAFSMNAGQAAFSMNAGKVAFSMKAAGKVAWSQGVNQVACSMAGNAPVGNAAGTTYSGEPGPAASARFNTVRPSLARAA